MIMAVLGSDNTRQDRAVIMARGSSSRMGVPKGLLRFQESGPTFLRTLVDLYLKIGIPVDVVTTPSVADAYQVELPQEGDARIIAAGPGGDTALTLLVAWRAWQSEGTECTHVWAHPVDMPLVLAGSLEELRQWSCGQPGRSLRPSWQKEPGHPVLLPVGILERLQSRPMFHEKPVRMFLEDEEPGQPSTVPVMLEVADRGVVQDFDCPEDLEPGSHPANNEGAS